MIEVAVSMLWSVQQDVNETLKFTFDSNPNSKFAISPTVQCSLVRSTLNCFIIKEESVEYILTGDGL